MLEVIPAETLRQTYVRGPLNIHYICDPEIITELLVGAGRSFPKAKFTKDIIGSAVGNGLILSEGEKWRKQRRRYSPLFAARNISALAGYFAETGMEVAESLAAQQGPVDVSQIAPASTLANISRVIFSGNEEVSSEQIRTGLIAYFEYISKLSLFDLMGLPKWLPRVKWLRSKAPVTDMRELARQVIDQRRSENRAEARDFLDFMIEALDADFEDPETTIDNLLTFVVAGHETSANALAWGYYLLALDQDMQERIRHEIRSVRPEGGIAFDDLQQMPLLRAHIKETLRLYPSAAFFARDAASTVTVKGITFEKGDALFFPVYSLHRNAALWDEPDQYDPSRFMGEPPQRGQYIPFGAGPRICIGAQYAETEIMVLMASVLRDVRFSLSSAAIPTPVLTFTMRTSGPLILETERA
ncbi:Cytochrome P450 [Cribrihabitans marinus]|uniref:Cytochrome P450 n=2 Tax=Cribrihabitans marinus TaxID=1227549 RepID=A0A1H7DQQ1_9RHOB|nr:cytochrome P450 [Cribrihabitans marinus]SEK04093.1 Cytochrome P450 [Cribrihabitans marinus]